MWQIDETADDMFAVYVQGRKIGTRHTYGEAKRLALQTVKSLGNASKAQRRMMESV